MNGGRARVERNLERHTHSKTRVFWVTGHSSLRRESYRAGLTFWRPGARGSSDFRVLINIRVVRAPCQELSVVSCQLSVVSCQLSSQKIKIAYEITELALQIIAAVDC
jgi:hypothetical protein